MIERLATIFVKFQSDIGTIQDDDVNVYQYGYTLMIEVILNMTFLLIVGALLGQIKEIVFFLCMFIPLRSFSGGYHANKAWKCIVLSNLVVIGVVVISKFMILNDLMHFVENIIIIATALVIMFLSPVESRNKKLNANEKKVYKCCTWMVVAIELIIANALTFMKMDEYYHIVLLSQVIQLFSIILNFCTKSIYRV